MQIRILILAALLYVTTSHQTCSTTDAHGIPSCAINAALDVGNTIGLLQTCQYDICCWCSDTNFTSQLNETWKGCSEADRNQAYQFFQSECTPQNSATTATNTTSSQNHTASSSSTPLSPINSPTSAVPSSLSTILATSSSSPPPVPTSQSTSTTSSSPTHANRAATSRKLFNSVIIITFVMAGFSYIGL